MPLHVTLAMPTQPVADLTAIYVQLPSVDGSMGVLQNHAPLRCVLEPGLVSCRLADESVKVFAVSAGLAMIRENEVTILADAAEAADSIDVRRAEAARQRAQKRLETRTPDTDVARAEAALRRAMTRIQAARVVVSKHAH